MKLPKRWLKYSRSGVIDSTRFVAFKVPLSKERSWHLNSSQRFTPEDLIRMHPDIGLVIDLSFSHRFYSKTIEFEDRHIEHVKIMSMGQVVPTNEQFNRFAKVVDGFIRRHPDHGLIGVHCTHGVNRTGYYICRYMIERMGFHPEEAINTFERCRGHQIERKNYKDNLLTIRRSIQPDEGRGDGGTREREVMEEKEEEEEGWTVMVKQRKRRIDDQPSAIHLSGRRRAS